MDTILYSALSWCPSPWCSSSAYPPLTFSGILCQLKDYIMYTKGGNQLGASKHSIGSSWSKKTRNFVYSTINHEWLYIDINTEIARFEGVRISRILLPTPMKSEMKEHMIDKHPKLSQAKCTQCEKTFSKTVS